MIKPPICAVAFAGLLPLTGAAAAGPSFSCAKAESPTEKTICVQPELAALDRQLGKAWKRHGKALFDPEAQAQVRTDQNAWLSQRERCRSDVACIRSTYQHRLGDFGEPPDSASFAGSYVAEHRLPGGVEIYRVPSGGYLISASAVEPGNARWVCQFDGRGSAVGNALSASADGGKVLIQRSQKDGSLELDDGEASGYCGLNGSFSGRYVRSRP